MPPAYRIIEITVYSLLNFLPYMVLALYPFNRFFRYSKAVTIVLFSLITLLQIALGLSAAFLPYNNVGFISFLSTALYFIFYFYTIKTEPGKLLFTMLIISNIANFVVVASKCIEGLIFPLLAQQKYRWSFSAVMAVLLFLIIPPLFLCIKKYYADIVANDSLSNLWKYLWLIPATFYLIWFYYLYGSEQGGLYISLRPMNTLFLLCINCGAFLIYYVVICLITEYNRNIELEKKNHMLMLENLQYDNLKNKIAETRRIRHDLRHHIAIITGCLNDKEYDRLNEYLKEYCRMLPEDNSVVLCRNYTVNLLLLYFSQLAHDNETDFIVYADIPEKLAILESDLSVILGNLLENAVNACAAVKNNKRQIIFRGKTEDGTLLITIDNTFENKLKTDKDGNFISTKHTASAIGIKSVRYIASRYGGTVKTEAKEGVFYASVMLNLTALTDTP